MQELEAFIRKNRAVGEKQLPFFLNWVSRCLRICKKRYGDEVSDVEITNFQLVEVDLFPPSSRQRRDYGGAG